MMDQAVSRFAKLVDDQSEIEKQDVDSTKKEDSSGQRYVLRILKRVYITLQFIMHNPLRNDH